MFIEISLIIAALILLYFGAEYLVKGGASLAARLGVSALVVGLTVVAMGTSMPELVVSVRAALGGSSEIAVGNAIGSNIFNIGFILALAAIISPLTVRSQLVKWDTPVLIGASLLFLFLFSDYKMGRIEGVLFLLLLIGYTWWSVYQARRAKKNEQVLPEEEAPIEMTSAWWQDLLYIAVGLFVLVAGSNLLVENAVLIAKALGMSDAVIGMTIVAAGTSMPELATTVVAAMKKRADIAVGNIIGSNIFNLLAIFGTSSLITPIVVDGFSWLDLGMMFGLTLILLPVMKSGAKISRWEGFLLLVLFLAYMTYLLLNTAS